MTREAVSVDARGRRGDMICTLTPNGKKIASITFKGPKMMLHIMQFAALFLLQQTGVDISDARPQRRAARQKARR